METSLRSTIVGRRIRRLALVAALAAAAGCNEKVTPPDPCVLGDAACSTPGNICTIVGSGNSAFNATEAKALCTDLYQPVDVTVDDQNRLTFSDQNNLRVRRMDADGVVRVIAGNGQFANDPPPGSPATSFPVFHPSELTYDSDGNLYVAIFHRQQVVKITRLGQFVPLAGTGFEGFAGDGAAAVDCELALPRGVAVDDSGNVYIADTGNNRVRKIQVTTGNIITIAGSDPGYAGDDDLAVKALLLEPYSLCFDPQGRLVIADWGNNVVRRIDLATGIITRIAGDTVPRFAGDGGSALSASLKHPEDVGYGPDGYLYIADSGNHCVRKVSPAGNISTVAGVGGQPGFDGDGGPAGQAHLDTPAGVGFDAQGNLWIADTFNNRIRRVTK